MSDAPLRGPDWTLYWIIGPIILCGGGIWVNKE